MKILFAVYRLEYADHIAISYLSAIAKQANHQTYFCAMETNDFLSMVGEIKPDVIAYSATILGYEELIILHKKALKIYQFVSIMGGPHPTLYPESFPDSGMDAFCIGEGEYAFRDFLERVSEGKPFDDVANLITWNKTNPVRPLIDILDSLPPADRDLVLANSFLKNTGKKTFYATRGCPFSCSYCCNNYYHRLYKGKGKILRRFSVERIIREIEDVMSKYRMDFIRFGDDCFVWQVDDWLKEFVDKYPKRVGRLFSCYMRFDMINTEMLQMLKKAGCHSVILSVDSTSKHLREKILKRNMPEVDIISNLKLIRFCGIETYVNFMLGVPESTLQDDLDTIEFSRKADISYTAYSTTVPLKMTELYDYCVEKKFINPSTYQGQMAGRSTLNCFTEKEKDIRYNIHLLGPVVAKLPAPFYNLGISIIKTFSPNRVFKMIQKMYYEHSIKNVIFKIPKGA